MKKKKKEKKTWLFLFSRNKKSSGQISPCDKCSLKPPPCSPRLFSVKRGGGVWGGPWGLKDVPPQLDLGGDPWLCWTFSRCEVPSIYLRLSFLSPSLSLPVRRCWPDSAASVEIYQSPGEYRMPLSENSDPAVLDRRLNASPILSLKTRKEEGRGRCRAGRRGRDRFERRFRWPGSPLVSGPSRFACHHSDSTTRQRQTDRNWVNIQQIGQRHLWLQLGNAEKNKNVYLFFTHQNCCIMKELFNIWRISFFALFKI